MGSGWNGESVETGFDPAHLPLEYEPRGIFLAGRLYSVYRMAHNPLALYYSGLAYGRGRRRGMQDGLQLLSLCAAPIAYALLIGTWGAGLIVWLVVMAPLWLVSAESLWREVAAEGFLAEWRLVMTHDEIAEGLVGGLILRQCRRHLMVGVGWAVMGVFLFMVSGAPQKASDVCTMVCWGLSALFLHGLLAMTSVVSAMDILAEGAPLAAQERRLARPILSGAYWIRGISRLVGQWALPLIGIVSVAGPTSIGARLAMPFWLRASMGWSGMFALVVCLHLALAMVFFWFMVASMAPEAHYRLIKSARENIDPILAANPPR